MIFCWGKFLVRENRSWCVSHGDGRAPHAFHQFITIIPRWLLTLLILWLGALALHAERFAAPPKLARFQIPAGAAERGLRAFAQQAGVEVMFEVAQVRGIQTRSVVGSFTPRSALEILVEGTGLVVLQDEPTGALTVKSSRPAAPPIHHPKKTDMKVRKTLRGWLAALLLSSGASQLPAQPQGAAGTIAGRVLNAGSGQYMNRVHITVEGTNAETFTDNTGYYMLPNVAAGTVRITATYTGLPPQVQVVEVSPGATATRDFRFTGLDAAREAAGETVALNAFTVTAARQMDGAAIAVNEQRFAPNMKSVLSTDEFGEIPDGNVGEFIKFMPGVAVSHAGGDMRTISLNGAPSQYVPITIAGFDVASAASSTTGRTIELEQISVNNVSRIEINQSPTAESPGAALAGSVNLVPRSAFERARAETTLGVYLMMRDKYTSLGKSPSAHRDTRKVWPGFDLNAIVPVSKSFGFTVSASASRQFNAEDSNINAWRGANASTNGTTYPDTTPDKPYLTNYTTGYNPKFTDRQSGAVSIDYRLSDADRLSFSFQMSRFTARFGFGNLVYNLNGVVPGDYAVDHAHGLPGTGTVQFSGGGRDKAGTTWTPNLIYRHEGKIYRAEAGLGMSHASNHYRDIDKGYFMTTSATMRNVTIDFDEVREDRPGRIAVRNAAGDPVDPSKLSNYTLDSFSSGPIDSTDLRRTAYANIRRDFDLRVPLTIKMGLDAREITRDIRKNGLGNWSVNYLGTGSNDFAIDRSMARRPSPYGFPPLEWVDLYTMYQTYQNQPQLFGAVDENSRYRSYISNSKRASELVSSAYGSADVRLMKNRLRLLFGLRAEQTNVEGQGPLTDASLNFQRDGNGNILRDSAGKPLLIIPTTNALGVSKLTFLDRGQIAKKEYLRWFPSINATFNITDSLVARAAAYSSVGRPDFNQYAGGITLPDLELPPSPTSNRITVNNVGIKAWSATTSKLSLEYYFPNRGALTVGVTRRDYYNFFGGTTFVASPEFLALYDLDPQVYGQYYVTTQYNLPTAVRTEIVNVDYRQPLAFLPHWARGVQVFANLSAQHIQGDVNANFQSFTPRTYNWGVSLTRPKFSLNANWSHKAETRRGLVSVRSGAGDIYSWAAAQTLMDVSGEYRLNKTLSVYANMRNVRDVPFDTLIYGTGTPQVAKLNDRRIYGSTWVFGLRGRF